MNSFLLDALFWGSVVSCAVAQGFILRAVLRTPPRPAAGASPVADPASATVPHPRRWLEIGWAVLPAFLLAAAFIGAWRLMHPTGA